MTASGGMGRLGVYAVSVFAVAPLLATLLFHGIEAAGGEPPPLHELTADCLKLVALLGLWPLLRSCGLRGAAAWGWAVAPGGLRRLAGGATLGLITIGLTVALVMSLGLRVLEPDLDAGEILQTAVLALLIATAVSLIEETWFRGALPSVLAPMDPRAALILIAFIYAALHFVRPDLVVERPEAWTDAYRALGGMFGRMTDAGYVDGFAALLAAGLVLGVLRERTGDVVAAIGCHAGWVFGIQFTRGITDAAVPARDTAWVSAYDGIIGLPFIVLLAISCVVAARFTKPCTPALDNGD